MFTGSLKKSGPGTFAVWTYILANKDKAGMIDIDPFVIAHYIGMTEEEVKLVVHFLEQADPESRSQDEGGARIVHCVGPAYRVVNHTKYTRMTDHDQKSKSNAEKQKRYRDRKRVTGNAESTKGNAHNVTNVTPLDEIRLDEMRLKEIRLDEMRLDESEKTPLGEKNLDGIITNPDTKDPSKMSAMERLMNNPTSFLPDKSKGHFDG